MYNKFKNNDNYKPILDFLMAKDYLDDDITIPSFKEMEEKLGIKMYHLIWIDLDKNVTKHQIVLKGNNSKFNNFTFYA